jgi:hypothetical protein
MVWVKSIAGWLQFLFEVRKHVLETAWVNIINAIDLYM